MTALANWPVLGIVGAILALITPIIAAVATVSLNRANAEKLRKEAKKIGDDAEKSKADTAEAFNRIASDWTTRIVQSNDRLELRIGKLVTVVEDLTDAVDHVTPLLDPLANNPAAAKKVRQLRIANSAARRAI